MPYSKLLQRNTNGKGQKLDVFQFFTTPQMLHDLADTLQKRWDRAILDDDVPSITIHGDATTELRIVADQDETHRQKAMGK